MARIYQCDACGKKSRKRMLTWTSYTNGAIDDFDFCEEDAEVLDQLVRKLVKDTKVDGIDDENVKD